MVRGFTRTLLAGALLAACHGGDGHASEGEDHEDHEGAAGPMETVPMELGAASNFSQGWNEATLRAALALPVRRFRDSVRWPKVERERGALAFPNETSTYPALLETSGAKLTLTLSGGNPNYDNGGTPYSDEALAAFGRFAATVVSRYPAIDTVEIGNEVNGGNFVYGAVKQAGLAKRTDYHLAIVRAASEAIHNVRPDVRIIGGATHSLPAGFLWKLLDTPGSDAIEGLAVHPYTTPIDQLPAQFEVLRRHASVARLPVYVTEFGSQNPQTAPDDLLRGYATLAALGVKEMDWYPLNERGDGMVPLLRRDQSLTSAGMAFRFIQQHLAGRIAGEYDPDPFTLVRTFGPDIWVLWGAARGIEIDKGVTAFDATGSRIGSSNLVLAPDKAIVLIGSVPLEFGQNVRLGCQSLIADSFYQFAYPKNGGAGPAGDGFERFARVAGRELPLQTLPGQQRAGVPWTPYLGLERGGFQKLRLLADSMLPALPGPDDAIVHRFIAKKMQRLHLDAELTASPSEAISIRVTLKQSGRTLFDQSGTGPIRIDKVLSLAAGESLAISVSGPGKMQANAADYRIRLFDADKCLASNSPG